MKYLGDVLNIIFGAVIFSAGIRAVLSEQTRASSEDQPNEEYRGESAIIIGWTGISLGALFIIVFGGALLGIEQCVVWRLSVQKLFKGWLL